MSFSYQVSFRGKPACPCLAEWLPAYEKELLRRGVIKSNIDIYQLIGGAAASGGTHATGGAFDIVQRSDEAVWVARQMGADATWNRATWSPPHAHGVLRGCPHNGPARYQIVAVDAGYNGLGYKGMAGKDDGPRPLSYRTWREGIAWARLQAGGPVDRMNPNNYFVGAEGDHVLWLARRLMAHGVRRPYKKNGPDRHFSAVEDMVAVRRFQKKQGWSGSDANGLPGKITLRLLAGEPKRRVSIRERVKKLVSLR